jgi:hypothetical protein
MRTIWFLVGAALLVGLVAGCTGSTRKKPVKVEGSVLVDGQPMAGVEVTFSPIDGKGMAAQGRTDAAGNFSLTTYSADDGAVPGEYKVLVSKGAATAEGFTPPPGAGPKEMEAAMKKWEAEVHKPKEKAAIAAAYGDLQKTNLKAVVPVENPPLVLKVSSQ